MHQWLRNVTLSVTGLSALALLAGCGGGATPAPPPAPASVPAATSATAPAPAPTSATASAPAPASTTPDVVAPPPTPTETTAPAPTGKYKAASWANPINVKGSPAFSVEKDGLRVDAYLAGKDKASKDSIFVDNKTKKNVWPKGKPIAYFIYVVTNTSGKAQFISQSGPTAIVRLDSMNYLGGIGRVANWDSAQAAKVGANQLMMKPKDFPKDLDTRAELKAGESGAVANVVPVKTGEPYTFSIELWVYPKQKAKTAEGAPTKFDPAQYTFK